jgi:homoserine dehydrogenase
MNGTSNYILTQMELGMSYKDALLQAQELGYAEADLTCDVKGLDTMAKVMILSNVVFNTQLSQEDITVREISKITLSDINEASIKNMRWKLTGGVWKDNQNEVHGSGSPRLVPKNDSLYGILGDTTIVGAGAGKIETGFALYNDIISIVNG